MTEIMAIIIEYNKSSTLYFSITGMLDNMVLNHNCKFDTPENLNNKKNNLKDYMLEKYGCIPKFLISFLELESFENIIDELSNILKVVFIIDDIHHSKRIRKVRCPVINKSYICFNTYGYQFNKWGLPNIENNYFFPHSAHWIIDFNENPINKVLGSGRISSIYPDREFFFNLAEKNKHVEIFKCSFGYRDSNQNNIFGKRFYEYLNKYLCCFVDCARDYILCKTFEICGCGSLLLCMNENLVDIFEKLGFKDNYNYISCNRENIEEKIKFIVDDNNKSTIDQIRKNGYELIKEKHNSDYRCKIFIDILNGNFKSDVHHNIIYDTKYKLAF